MKCLLTDKTLEKEILEGTIEVTLEVEDLIEVEINNDRYQVQEILDVVALGQEQDNQKMMSGVSSINSLVIMQKTDLRKVKIVETCQKQNHHNIIQMIIPNYI